MNLLVISGGGHPYHESTPVLLDFLGKDGHEVKMTEDATILTTDEMKEFDALVFNTRREFDAARDMDMTLEENERVALSQYVGGGHGFVCIHISGCRPADWREYHDITGGGWISGESYHPPYGQFTVNVSNSDHPCAEGIEDFVTNDELYMNIATLPGNDVFLTGASEDGTHAWGPDRAPTFMPGGAYDLAWTRNYGNGKVFKTTLGHNGLSFETPQFQRLILNGVNWVTDKG